ncbi:MAG: DUF368 domain-containing protein [Bacteroidota bacterium]
MQRSLSDYVIITLKGIVMGAADVVPGVSGGTIAFISGIYEELITAINNINLSAWKLLKARKFSMFWKHINGNFLSALVFGIFLSVISLAKGIKWLLEHQPVLLWSFFFGLVLSSVVFVAKAITKWNLITVLFLLLSSIVAYYITTLPPLQHTENFMFLFLSGALAICAMILPGISGAFILVLLGAYQTILSAIDERNFKIIGITALGAVFGLLSFSRLLKWLFVHYKNATLALLTGFIIGSLNKIWPWKKTISWYVASGGEQMPLLQKSIMPFQYAEEHQLLWAILLSFIGFLMIFLLEKLAVKKTGYVHD